MLLVPLAAYGQTNTNLEQKMRTIIIPSIDIRITNAIDALGFFVYAATAIEPDDSCIGLLQTNKPSIKEYYTYKVEDGTPLQLPPITLTDRRITMYDAIDRISKEAGLTFRFEDGIINFYTQDGKKLIREKHVEQPGPGYPPQGVGSPDP